MCSCITGPRLVLTSYIRSDIMPLIWNDALKQLQPLFYFNNFFPLNVTDFKTIERFDVQRSFNPHMATEACVKRRSINVKVYFTGLSPYVFCDLSVFHRCAAVLSCIHKYRDAGGGNNWNSTTKKQTGNNLNGFTGGKKLHLNCMWIWGMWPKSDAPTQSQSETSAPWTAAPQKRQDNSNPADLFKCFSF